MGLFDYVIAPPAECSCCGDQIDGWQTKDTYAPYMQHIERDAVDEDGKYLVNEYYSFCNNCYKGTCGNKTHKLDGRNNVIIKLVTFKRINLSWKRIPEKTDD